MKSQKIIKIKVSFILVLSLFLCQILSAQEATDSTALTIDRIVAIVNNEVITQADLNRAEATIRAEYMSIYPDPQEFTQKLTLARKNIINQMIEEKLILSEAKRYEIKVEQAEIEARIDKIREGFSSEEEFEQILEAECLTLKDLRERFSEQEIMRKAVDHFVRAEIKVDPQQLQQYYQAHKSELARPEKAHVHCILIKCERPEDEYEALHKARRVYERLKSGDDFEELVQEHSEGANVEEGGDLGWIEKGQLIEAIDQAIFSLGVGEFTDVLKTPSGYRIFKVEEIEPKQPLTFSQAQDVIRQILYEQKFTQAFKAWIEKLKQDAYIEIKEDTTEVERPLTF